MSKNNKNAKRLAQARETSKNRQNGTKGVARKTSTSKKKNAWWQKFSTYSAFVRGGKKPRRDQGNEVGDPAEEASIAIPTKSLVALQTPA